MPVVTAAVDVDAINDMDTVPWFPMSVILIEQLRNYPEIRYRLLDSQGTWYLLCGIPAQPLVYRPTEATELGVLTAAEL